MKSVTSFAIAAGVVLGALGASGQAEIGQPAPAFSLLDIHGKTHTLEEYLGKTVVLEWTNVDCPFVKKHYTTDNLPALQREFTAQGVVWLRICSSAPGKQGYFTAEEWPRVLEKHGDAASAVLLDPSGEAGRAYDARTTPHMYIIDADGILAYQGAIDDNSSWDPKTVEGAVNYVREALSAMSRGEPIAVTVTRAYGCSVKY